MKKVTYILLQILSYAIGFAMGWFFPLTSICGLLIYTICTVTERKIAFDKEMENIESYFGITREPDYVLVS